MARLETQINQIYLIHPEAKKTSLVLYEEALTSTANLYMLAEIHGALKKTASLDIKRISEIILESFRINKKLTGELLFEAALSQINQNLADLAHEGRKSWVGKFSCIIALKSSSNIFLANTGPAAAWLKRSGDLIEILPGEKKSDHPIKTFTNFTQGKLIENDTLILTASNIFNYVSAELLAKIFDENDSRQACEEITRIIQESINEESGFGAFLLDFSKNTPALIEDETAAYTLLPEEEPIYAEVVPQTAPVRAWKNLKISQYIPALPSLPQLPRRLPFQIRLPGIEFRFFRNLSTAGKFLFITFTICLILFIINLGIYGIRLRRENSQTRLNTLVEQFNQKMADSQSALIYKDDNQALNKFNEALSDFENIRQMNSQRAAELESNLNDLKILVNKISIVQNPGVAADLKHQPIYVARAASKFIFAGEDSNSLSSFDSSVKDYFLLNSLKSKITGIASWNPAGVVVATAGEVYHINEELKQFESIISYPEGDVTSVKSSGANLYALNKAKGQIARISFARNIYNTQAAVTTDLAAARDFGVDKDFYILYPDKVHKAAGNNIQVFPLPPMSDSMTNAERIFVAGNIYILEPNKKRVIVLNKNGVLLNQIFFPNSENLSDLYINEATRNMYLLDTNKLLQITF